MRHLTLVWCARSQQQTASVSSAGTTYLKAWYAGDRSGALEGLVNELKFVRVKDAAIVLGDLLDERLPMVPNDTVVVPISTVPLHIRQRGYDHTLLIARRLAKRRRLVLQTPLTRLANHQQHGQPKAERFAQAEKAFACTEQFSADVPYLLIDDVVTTNATLRYAAAALQAVGATTAWVAALARQPLDKQA